MSEHIVTTTTGKIRGFETDGHVAYLGIPYAEPPIGSLRFKRAVPVTPWDGVLEAIAYGDKSIQTDEVECPGEVVGSEDCLTLNVRTPIGAKDLPVLVYIHGGGYNTGAASDPLYDGEAFVKDGIVYVSFQYRLNVLGFFDFTTYPGCEDFDSNCGVSDHLIAMRWIHDNIKAFGGDPDRITIAGESAGATSVELLMAAPAAKGTFSQAIISSAIANGFMSHEVSRENIDLFIEGMEWTEKDLPKLKTMDPALMQKGYRNVAKMHQYKNPGINLPSPVIDELIPARPIEAIGQGSAKGVKLMIGTNRDEGTMFVRPEDTNFPNSWDMVRDVFKNTGNEAGLEGILDYYKKKSAPTASGIDQAFYEFATDYAFQVPDIKLADAQKENGDVYMYRFEFVSKSAKESGMKASHAFDLPCAFAKQNHPFSQMFFDGESEQDVQAITDAVHGAWVSFIKTGRPAGEIWPKYTGHRSPICIFDRETKVVELDRSELMDVWGDMKFYQN